MLYKSIIFLFYLLGLPMQESNAFLECKGPYDCITATDCKARHPNLNQSLFPCGGRKERRKCCPLEKGRNVKPSPTTSPPVITTSTVTPTTSSTTFDPPPNIPVSLRSLPATCGTRSWVPSSDSATNKIHKGTDVEDEEYPWMVFFTIKNQDGETQFCGGTLIDQRHILTAAHCLKHNDFSTMLVTFGERIVSKTCERGRNCVRRSASKVFIHEKFVEEGDAKRFIENDIAVVRLNDSVPVGAIIQPVCLPFNKWGSNLKSKEALWIAGWGAKSRRVLKSDVLQKANVFLVPGEQCQQIFKLAQYPQTLNKAKVLCTNGVKNQRGLKGDSGGPLMVMETRNNQQIHVVVGVLSFGPGNWKKKTPEYVPVVFAKVRKHLDWIQRKMAS